MANNCLSGDLTVLRPFSSLVARLAATLTLLAAGIPAALAQVPAGSEPPAAAPPPQPGTVSAPPQAPTATPEQKPPGGSAAGGTVTATRPSPATAPSELRLISWGGAYGKAQEIAVLQPLRAKLGIKLRDVRRATEAPLSENADVVEVDQATLLAGCASGRFARISGLALKPSPDGKPASEDFLPGAISDCGVGTFAWSALFVVDSGQFKNRAPQTISQIFDTRRYPGKRALLPLAPYVVTMTALAAGIEAKDLSAKLATQEGADAVFARLEAIRKDIVWASSPETALALVDDRKAAVAMSFSGRVFRRTIAGHLTAMWDGHVYDFASWAVPSSSTKLAAAKSFIAAATAPELLAAQATHWPYGPMRSSALPLAVRHARVDIPLAPHLPTSPERLKAGVKLDAAFWARHGTYYERRLGDFRDGLKFGIRIPIPASVRRNAGGQPERSNPRRAIDG